MGELSEDIMAVKGERGGVQRDAANGILSRIQALNLVIHNGPKTQGAQYDGENGMMESFVKCF